MVKFDLVHPTEHQLREGLVSGLIAVSAAVPLLIIVFFINRHPLRWGYMGGALACIFVSVIYAAFFMAMTKRKDVGVQASLVFVVVCLALAALGFIELSTSNMNGTYTPAVLVGVVFVCIVGDRPMRIGIDVYAIVLIGLITWMGGLRGSDFVAVVVVYASTVVVITWITARTVRSLNDSVNFRQAVGALNEVFESGDPAHFGTDTDAICDLLVRGLPLVTDVMPADRVAVFARNGRVGQFTTLGTWPAERPDASDLAELPELAQALRADAVVLDDTHCVVPIGYCSTGEMVMVVERKESKVQGDHRAREAAELMGAAFLRVTSRANYVNGLHAEIRTDPLTGLANRRTLYERIQIEMEHALRSETPLTVAMIDLDHFKQYNDCHGHVAGDTLLRAIAALMVSNIRGQDLVVRYGGEEFCLVLPETDVVGGHHLLDKLRTGGRETTTDFGVTLSAGLTNWDGMEDITSLIERADQALYRAKESGRNRVVSIQSLTEF